MSSIDLYDSSDELHQEFVLLLEHMKRDPIYKSYRNKQRTQPKPKWPEHYEDLFLEACVRFPPCGRDKVTDNVFNNAAEPSKQLGRNELIACFMMSHLGITKEEFCRKPDSSPRRRGGNAASESREARKIISSHLQVLRKKFSHDPFVLKYLGNSSDDVPSRMSSPAYRSSGSSRDSPYRVTKSSRTSAPSCRVPLSSRGLKKVSYELLNDLRAMPAIFTLATGTMRRKHIITQSDDDLALYRLIDHPDWETSMPQLATLVRQDRVGPDCQVFLADASLDIRAGTERHRLQTEYTLQTVRQGARRLRLQCETSFYQLGEAAHPMATSSAPVFITECNSDDDSDHLSRESTGRMLLGLDNEYLAQHLDRASRTLQQAINDGDDSSQQAWDDVAGLSAIQMITSHATGSVGRPEHGKLLTVICWRFSLGGGTTKWHKVILPAAGGLFTDPAAPLPTSPWLDEFHQPGQAEKSLLGFNPWDSPYPGQSTESLTGANTFTYARPPQDFDDFSDHMSHGLHPSAFERCMSPYSVCASEPALNNKNILWRSVLPNRAWSVTPAESLRTMTPVHSSLSTPQSEAPSFAMSHGLPHGNPFFVEPPKHPFVDHEGVGNVQSNAQTSWHFDASLSSQPMGQMTVADATLTAGYQPLLGSAAPSTPHSTFAMQQTLWAPIEAQSTVKSQEPQYLQSQQVLPYFLEEENWGIS